jgi:hypothetical protein
MFTSKATIHSPISKALQSDVSSYTCACLDLTVCGYVVFSAVSGFQRDGMIGERTIGPHHDRVLLPAGPTHVGAVQVKGCLGIDPVHIVRGRRQHNRMKDHVTQVNIGLGAKSWDDKMRLSPWHSTFQNQVQRYWTWHSTS